MPRSGVSSPDRHVDTAPALKNDTQKAEAEQAGGVLSAWLQALSPGRKVRAAAGTPGRWTNLYPAPSIRVDEASTARPVAMYLACRRRRWGGFRFLFVVFDLDAKRGGRVQVLADAAAIMRQLATHGIPSVPVASGPSGGVHLWAACPEGLTPEVVRRIADAASRLYPTLDTGPLTNGVSGVVRPPGALHRNGGYARLTRHTVAEAVAVLSKGAPAAAWDALLSTVEGMAGAPSLTAAPHSVTDKPVTQRLAEVGDGGNAVPPSIAARGPVIRPRITDPAGRIKLAGQWRPLGPQALAALHRSPDDRPGAHSTAVHAPLRSMALAGWSYGQMRQAAEYEELTPALEWLRTASTDAGGRVQLDPAEADRRAERAWWLAVQAAARMPARLVDEQADEPDTPGARAAVDLLARIEAADPERWRRQSGPSDRNCLRAVAWLMAQSGTDEISADVRRVGVLMGKVKSTAALALGRVVADGWLSITAATDNEAFTARRVALAADHQCTDDPHHMCADYGPAAPLSVTGEPVTEEHPDAAGQQPADHVPASQKTPGHHGSDGRRNAAPPPPSRTLLSDLARTISDQQSGLWQALGHHAGRTLEALQQGTPVEEAPQVTGYTRRTTRRHVQALTALRLVTLHQDAQGRTVAVRTARSLYDAAAERGTATRHGERAMSGWVDRVRYAWWLREVGWCRLPRAAKRRAGHRADAGQLVLAGQDPHARAYPRKANGEADHGRAWDLEALRTNALTLVFLADELAQAGQVVDPAHLARQLAERQAEETDAAPELAAA